MKAVVPAAGRGTRLAPVAGEVPKPLVEVGGRPLLAHALRALVPLAPEEVIVVVGPGGDAIPERMGRAFEGLPLRYARQPRADGLARALLAAGPHLDGPFLVLNADNVVRGELERVVGRFRSGRPDAVLLTERVPPGRARQGVCRTDADGTVRELVEYPDAADRRVRRVATGFAVHTPAILGACSRVPASEAGEHELADAVNLLIEEGGRVASVELEGWRVNVNDPDDLRRLEERLGEGPGEPPESGI